MLREMSACSIAARVVSKCSPFSSGWVIVASIAEAMLGLRVEKMFVVAVRLPVKSTDHEPPHFVSCENPLVTDEPLLVTTVCPPDNCVVDGLVCDLCRSDALNVGLYAAFASATAKSAPSVPSLALFRSGFRSM